MFIVLGIYCLISLLKVQLIILWKKVYLCDMNIDKASYQLRQSNQIMLDKRSFVRGISKLANIINRTVYN